MSRVTRAARRIGLATVIAAATLAPSVASAGNSTPSTPPTLAGMLAPYATAFDTDNNNFNVGVHLLLKFPQVVKAAASPGNYTVFLPTDYAFRRLVKELTGAVVVSEAKLVEAVAAQFHQPFADVLQRVHLLLASGLADRFRFGHAAGGSGEAAMIAPSLRQAPRRSRRTSS